MGSHRGLGMRENKAKVDDLLDMYERMVVWNG